MGTGKNLLTILGLGILGFISYQCYDVLKKNYDVPLNNGANHEITKDIGRIIDINGSKIFVTEENYKVIGSDYNE